MSLATLDRLQSALIDAAEDCSLGRLRPYLSVRAINEFAAAVASAIGSEEVAFLEEEAPTGYGKSGFR